MICDDVLTLVGEVPAAHGVFEPVAEPQRKVFCQVNSVSRSEYFHALAAGITPRFSVRISEAADYQGEKIAIYHGERLRVIRTYVQKHAIELTLGEVTVDAEPI